MLGTIIFFLFLVVAGFLNLVFWTFVGILIVRHIDKTTKP